MRTLDLFSAAAGGWSLGMSRAGFTTIAACELIDWRRALYAVNNPGVRLYDDVKTPRSGLFFEAIRLIGECRSTFKRVLRALATRCATL